MISHKGSILLVAAILVLINSSLAARPPSPVCRTAPLPSIIPISLNETVRFDL